MPTVTPNAFLGRNITSIAITPQDVAADGTITANALGAKTVTGQVQSIRNMSTNELENVTGITQRRRNMIILETGTVYTISGFLLANDSVATPTNWIEAIVAEFDYVKLVFTRNGKAQTFYGVVHTYECNHQGKGQVPFSLELEMIDPGDVNPVEA